MYYWRRPLYRQIHNAAQHPVNLDRAQADAVEARTILDLKVGAAFTRMQTLVLQRQVKKIEDEKNIVSYGASQPFCSIPSTNLSFRSMSVPNLGFRSRQIQGRSDFQTRDLLVHIPHPVPTIFFSRRRRRDTVHMEKRPPIRVRCCSRHL